MPPSEPAFRGANSSPAEIFPARKKRGKRRAGEACGGATACTLGAAGVARGTSIEDERAALGIEPRGRRGHAAGRAWSHRPSAVPPSRQPAQRRRVERGAAVHIVVAPSAFEKSALLREMAAAVADEKAAVLAHVEGASGSGVPTAVEVEPPPSDAAHPDQGPADNVPFGHVQAPRVDLARGETLVCPAGKPKFIGATRGRHPIQVYCEGGCGYRGQACMEKRWGGGSWMWSLMTLGIGAPWGKCVAGDVVHVCPQCGRELAVSAIF